MEPGEGTKSLLRQIATFCCGFICASASLLGSYAPFGISITAAVPMKYVLAAFTGAIAGYVVFPAGGSFRYIAAMSAVIAIRWTLSDIKKLNRHYMYSSTVSFLPALATGLAMMSVGGFTMRGAALYLTEALLSSAAAFFISRTYIILSGTKSLGMLTPQELASLVMSGCIGLLASAGLMLGPLSAGRILSALIILFFARYGGVPGAAVAGCSTGIVMGMYSGEYAFLGAAFSFGGLAAGVFAPVGRLASSAALMMSCLVCAVQQARPEETVRILLEVLAASVIFMILPRSTANFLRGAFMQGNSDEHAEGLRRSIIMRLDFASKALADVSDEVEEVSEKLSRLVTPTISNVYEEATDTVCRRCGMRVFCWEHKDGVSIESFDHVTGLLQKNGSITEDDLREDFRRKCCRPREIAEAVNKSYRHYLAGEAAEKRIDEVRQVVAGQFCGLGDILGEMAEEYADYEVFDNELAMQVTMKLKELGIVPDAVSCRTDYLGRLTIEAETAETDPKKIKRAMLMHELSRLCGRKLEAPCITSALGSLRITMCERPCYDVEIASSQHISGDGRLCGDHMTYFTDGSGRMTAILSDGMGTGGRAAVDGGMASGIMEKLLKAGLGYDCSLKVVNSALLVKSGDESLATVDVAAVDLYSGRTSFMKAGAALSFIRKQGDMYRVDTPSLPAGILPQVEFSVTEDELSEGDIIVMVSDGAVATGEDWIDHIISGWEDKGMQQLADHITDEAVSRRTDGHDDDITVIAMRIRKNY